MIQSHFPTISSHTGTAAETDKPWDIRETQRIAKGRTADGLKFINHYVVLETIGHGRFAKVQLCERVAGDEDMTQVSGRHPAQERPKYALKVFSKRELSKMREYLSDSTQQVDGVAQLPRMKVVTQLDRVRDEIAIMRTLYHRNVVLPYEVMESEESDKLYLVLEYLAKGPVMQYHPETKDFISPITQSVLSEELARSHTRDILNGVLYLHQRGICHRDLKVCQRIDCCALLEVSDLVSIVCSLTTSY